MVEFKRQSHQCLRTTGPAALVAAAGLVGTPLFLGGCEVDSFLLDRSNMGRWEQTPAVVPVLDRLVAIEGPAGGQTVETSPVRPEDLIPEIESYRLGPGDVLEVVIADFDGTDREGRFPLEVDSRGYVDLPKIGSLLIDGLTVDDVQALIGRTARELEIVNDAKVSVRVTGRRKLTYNIIGGVNQPGLYPIPKPDYRLLDALAGAGRFSENVQSVYIIRQIPLNDRLIRGNMPGARPRPTGDGGTPGAPAGTNPPVPANPAANPPANPESVIDLIDELANPGGSGGGAKQNKPATPPDPGAMPGVFGNGRQPPTPPAPKPADQPAAPDPIVDLTDDPPAKGTPSPVAPNAKPAAKPEPKEGEPPATAAKGEKGETPDAKADDKPAVETTTPPQAEKFWIFRDGKWIQVTRATTPSRVPEPTEKPGPRAGPAERIVNIPPPGQPQRGGPAPEPYDDVTKPLPFDPSLPRPTRDPSVPEPKPSVPKVDGADQLVTQRVIEVPLGPLLAGSAQFNVIIRPGDIIRVPSPTEGIAYVAGEVNRPGPYNLPVNGRLTLLRVVNAAGGLATLAVPERTDITRVVGPDRQATIRVNMRAIAEATQPDIYIKPDDIINVGTDFWALPLTVVRNGFRFSYGFGFILDRNFDEDVFGPRSNFNR